MFNRPAWVDTLENVGEVIWNAPLASCTTIQTGGPAECLVQPSQPSHLSHLYKFAQTHKIPITILGKGSNVLVADAGIPGIVVRLVKGDFVRLQILENHQVRVGAGVLKSELLEFSIQENLTGLEFSSGVPGDLGGALKMNAGTKYGSYADILVKAKIFRPETLEVETVTSASAQSSYRHQTYIRDGLVMEALLQCQPGDSVTIRQEVDRIVAERAAKQPLEWPNFGSTFKNPDHPVSAGRMIERSGLKSLRVGGAQVSPKHANFILNDENATATDILKLICQVQEAVYEKYHVWLRPEVRLLGKHPFLPPASPPQPVKSNVARPQIQS